MIEVLAPQLKGLIKDRKKAPQVSLTDEEKAILQNLSGEPLHIDELTRKVQLPLNKVMALLTGLELKGLIQQAPGKRFYLV